MALINDMDGAARLARTIIADIALYNRDKIASGIKNDNIFVVLEAELKEGFELYKRKVDPVLEKKNNFFNRAVVDILIKRYGTVESQIW
ncbi:MAG: hypothetical protein HZB83_04235 [Deltaproteobacteria bacterium]|nr:hypothetical protein [Deltaproteobacteria bacterium]